MRVETLTMYVWLIAAGAFVLTFLIGFYSGQYGWWPVTIVAGFIIGCVGYQIVLKLLRNFQDNK